MAFSNEWKHDAIVRRGCGSTYIAASMEESTTVFARLTNRQPLSPVPCRSVGGAEDRCDQSEWL